MATAFFRAVSFCLTNSKDFYNVMRSAVCQHIIGNKELFEPFLNGEQSIDNHLKSSKMSQEGTWVTEVEIFATTHLLNIDIYTFSGWRWIRFLVSDEEPSEQSKTGAIYLNHHQQNHYNVILSINGHESDLTQKQNDEIVNEYEKRYRS